jgi:hypothetical protein
MAHDEAMKLVDATQWVRVDHSMRRSSPTRRVPGKEFCSETHVRRREAACKAGSSEDAGCVNQPRKLAGQRQVFQKIPHGASIAWLAMPDAVSIKGLGAVDLGRRG